MVVFMVLGFVLLVGAVWSVVEFRKATKHTWVYDNSELNLGRVCVVCGRCETRALFTHKWELIFDGKPELHPEDSTDD